MVLASKSQEARNDHGRKSPQPRDFAAAATMAWDTKMGQSPKMKNTFKELRMKCVVLGPKEAASQTFILVSYVLSLGSLLATALEAPCCLSVHVCVCVRGGSSLHSSGVTPEKKGEKSGTGYANPFWFGNTIQNGNSTELIPKPILYL